MIKMKVVTDRPNTPDEVLEVDFVPAVDDCIGTSWMACARVLSRTWYPNENSVTVFVR